MLACAIISDTNSLKLITGAQGVAHNLKCYLYLYGLMIPNPLRTGAY